MPRKLSLLLVEDTQSTKNVRIYIINIIMYMFSSFSYHMIAIYFSSLHQNIFLWEKLFILGRSDTFANDCISIFKYIFTMTVVLVHFTMS